MSSNVDDMYVQYNMKYELNAYRNGSLFWEVPQLLYLRHGLITLKFVFQHRRCTPGWTVISWGYIYE